MTRAVDRSFAQWLAVFLKGAAMGGVVAVPGVSVGTIAFITGVYAELLRAIASFGPASPGVSLRRGWAGFAERHRLAFLGVLTAGVAVSLVIVTPIVRRVADVAPVLVGAFFFGLIAASVFDLARRNALRHLLSAGVIGAVGGLFLAIVDIAPGDVTTLRLFGGAMLAAGAAILPGISGSYVFLMMGLYPTTLAAVETLDFAVLLPVGAGCVIGLALFARGLSSAMRRFYGPVTALLTGYMAGLLPTLWPWHLRAEFPGFERDADLPVMPWTHASVTGQDPQVLAAALLALGACAIVALLARSRGGDQHSATDRGV